MVLEALATILAAQSIAALKLSNFIDPRATPRYDINPGYSLIVRINVPFRKTRAYYDRRWVRMTGAGAGWSIESATLNSVRGDFIAAWDRRLGSETRAWRDGDVISVVSTDNGRVVSSHAMPFSPGPIYNGAEQVYFFDGGPRVGKSVRYLTYGSEPWREIRYEGKVPGTPLNGDQWNLSARNATGTTIGYQGSQAVSVMPTTETALPAFGTFVPSFYSQALYTQPVAAEAECAKAVNEAILEYATMRKAFESMGR